MNATVYDAAIFKYWKRDAAKSEIIAVVAVDAQHSNNSVDLLWFRLDSNNKLVSTKFINDYGLLIQFIGYYWIFLDKF